MLRAQIATQLALSDDPEIVRSFEVAAQGDADARVRDAARAALVARDPPKSGYLVTGTLPESVGEASGVRAGDIVLSYNGASTRDGRSLQQATSTVEGDAVEVVVFRDGEEVRMTVPSGALGVFGRGVAPKPKGE
jgi:S1-C subfamily serine protease